MERGLTWLTLVLYCKMAGDMEEETPEGNFEDMPPLEDDKNASDLGFQKSNRKHIRQKVSKLCSKLSEELFDLTSENVDSRGEEVRWYKRQLHDLDSNIQYLMWSLKGDGDELDAERNTCETYTEKLSKASRLLKSVCGVSSNVVPSSNSQIRLPQLPLPEYSHGEGESLEEFFMKFEAIVSKYSITEYEKYVLLEKQVSGEPLRLIRSLNSDSLCYSEAKKLLCRAFASPIAQKFDVIARMSKLNLSGPKDVYNFISDMRMIVNAVSNLKIDSDVILQYFVWSALPEDFKHQLVSVSNHNKPSLSKIQEHIFEAAERYVAISKSKEYSFRGNDKFVTGMAVNVEPNLAPIQPTPTQAFNKGNKPDAFKPCILCSNDNNKSDHPIHKCNKYATPKAKTDRLKVLKGCLRCANVNHFAKNCTFKFRKSCYFCKSPNHFSFLCMSANKDGYTNNIRNVHHMSVTCNNLQSGLSSNTILPTFTVNSVDGSVIRCLKDSGCTACFVDRALATRDKLKTLRNITVNVNGVNNSQYYNTKIVEMKLNMNDKIVHIPAIVLPKIKTQLNIDGLGKVVETLRSKGLELADSMLKGDSIDNIQFILGTNCGYLLPEIQQTFGTNNNCLISSTSLGVMLMGDVVNLEENLNFIPENVNCNTLIAEEKVSQRVDRLEKLVDTLTKNTPQSEPTLSNKSTTTNNNNLAEDTFDPLKVLDIHAFACHTGNYSLIENDSLLLGDNECLEFECEKLLNYENSSADNVKFDDMNLEILNSTLNKIVRRENGRLEVPIVWNAKTYQFLGNNYNISFKILMSVKKKLADRPDHLKLMNDVIAEQFDSGVITQITNLQSYVKSTNCSFLGTMPIFKLKRDTTKCRIVLLSNVTERVNGGISHNTAMRSGPCLNRKLITSLLQLRFDTHVLVFDLVKAFLQLCIPEVDTHRMCFLWFKDVKAGNFEVVGYKFERLPFGLKCSPFILMIALYYILIVDTCRDSDRLRDLKRLIWELFYMDNGAICSNSSEELKWSYEQLCNIFSPYGFNIQQYVTNDSSLSDHIHSKTGEKMDNTSKLFGLRWILWRTKFSQTNCH